MQLWSFHLGGGFYLGTRVQYLYGMASLYDQDAAIHCREQTGKVDADVETGRINRIVWVCYEACFG